MANVCATYRLNFFAEVIIDGTRRFEQDYDKDLWRMYLESISLRVLKKRGNIRFSFLISNYKVAD